MVSDLVTPVLLWFVECQTATNHRTGVVGVMKNNSWRQRCDRLGSENSQTLKYSPASDILSAVNDIVEPHVRSLCGSSGHPRLLSWPAVKTSVTKQTTQRGRW